MSKHEDILDIRDLAQEWRDKLIDIEDELLPSIDAYRALCRDLGIDADPDSLESYGDNYEPTLISEDHFTGYAQELAEDIGAVPSDLAWPLRCIDWERAADELRADYTSVRFDGHDYLVRA